MERCPLSAASERQRQGDCSAVAGLPEARERRWLGNADGLGLDRSRRGKAGEQAKQRSASLRLMLFCTILNVSSNMHGRRERQGLPMAGLFRRTWFLTGSQGAHIAVDTKGPGVVVANNTMSLPVHAVGNCIVMPADPNAGAPSCPNRGQGCRHWFNVLSYWGLAPRIDTCQTIKLRHPPAGMTKTFRCIILFCSPRVSGPRISNPYTDGRSARAGLSPAPPGSGRRNRRTTPTTGLACFATTRGHAIVARHAFAPGCN
jgi:hypothetical protein